MTSLKISHLDKCFTMNHDLYIHKKAFRFMVLHNNQTQLPTGDVMIAEYDLPNGDILGPHSYSRRIVFDDAKSLTPDAPKFPHQYEFNTLEWISIPHARLVWEGLVKNHKFQKLEMHPSSTMYHSDLLCDIMAELQRKAQFA